MDEEIQKSFIKCSEQRSFQATLVKFFFYRSKKDKVAASVLTSFTFSLQMYRISRKHETTYNFLNRNESGFADLQVKVSASTFRNNPSMRKTKTETKGTSV